MKNKKNILIVGASSFVGNNLILKLKKDFNVFGTFNKNSKNYTNKKNFYKVDLTLNNPIMPGMGHIADLYLYVDANTPSGSSYPIEVDKIVADANSIAMYTEMISSSVFVGTPMAHFSIDTSFSLNSELSI